MGRDTAGEYGPGRGLEDAHARIPAHARAAELARIRSSVYQIATVPFPREARRRHDQARFARPRLRVPLGHTRVLVSANLPGSEPRAPETQAQRHADDDVRGFVLGVG